MKSREEKQRDLEQLTQQFQQATAGMVVSFKNMTVPKDQELRDRLREANVQYVIVKNTLARRAAAGTPFEQATDAFKGVSAIAFTNDRDPVGLSKAISKYAKENADIFTFKSGIVEGKVVALRDVEAIATLPSKEELISKVMFLVNCQAQRLVTVLSAVPRNLAVVVKQIGEQKGETAS